MITPFGIPKKDPEKKRPMPSRCQGRVKAEQCLQSPKHDGECDNFIAHFEPIDDEFVVSWLEKKLKDRNTSRYMKDLLVSVMYAFYTVKEP